MSKHFVVYDANQSQVGVVFETLRTKGIHLIEAGPESHYRADIRNAQRFADARQFAQLNSEVLRLRFAILDAIKTGTTDALPAVLAVGSNIPAWDWSATS